MLRNDCLWNMGRLKESSLENRTRNYLRLADFQIFPVWKYDEDSELFHPVVEMNDLPERTRDLFISAELVTASGLRFDGYVVGVERIFSIGLFYKNSIYHLNKNLPDISREQIRDLFSNIGSDEDLEFSSLFPINFTTKWGGEVFVDFSGSINID